jgi:histidinol phosphatase-like enzyme
MKHLTIAIDFDGTIVENKWPHIGPEIPGAIQTIKRLHRHGHRIIVWTCRTGKQLEECIEWLVQHKVPFDAINANLPERIKAFGGDTRKVSADLYVDDKAIGMRKVHKREFWEYVRKEVNALSLEG